MCHTSSSTKTDASSEMIVGEHRPSDSKNESEIVRELRRLPLSSKISTKISHPQIIALVALASFILCASAYDFPIHQNLPSQFKFRNQQAPSGANRGHKDELQPSRRSDDSEQLVASGSENSEESDAKLRQLHQVVDSVAQLLNEEEQRQNGQNRNYRQQQQHADAIQKSLAFQAPELMSESAIRQAIEELERIQQQERRLVPSSQLVAESRQQSSIAAPEASSGDRRQSSIESLIDELGDELIDDQIAAASQEAERLLRQSENSPQQAEAGKRDASSSTLAPADYRSQPVNQSAPQTRPSTLAGQLDSTDSVLGSALANDFFTFHADPISTDKTQADTQAIPSATSSSEYQSRNQQPSSDVAPSQNDLDTAAQTRNAVTQQRGPQSQNSGSFNQGSANNLRFDLSQPAISSGRQAFGLNIETQQQRPSALPQQSDPDALVRAFRQQTGAASDSQQFPSSTLIPIPNVDNFWRPTGAQPSRQDIEDLNSQYDRVRSSTGLPPLPASRFQSLIPESLRPQGQHIHFTGHSLISSGENQQAQFAGPQQQQPNNRPAFSSTATPLISILSGIDKSGTNSVNWNPPPTVNGPTQSSAPQLFSQPFPTSTLPSLGQPGPTLDANVDGDDVDAPNQFVPAVNPDQPSLLFKNSFQNQPGPVPQNLKPQPPNSANNFVPVTEITPGPTAGSRFVQPLTTPSTATSTQWTPTSSQAPAERETSDSQPRTSVRALPNGQRFFSPNDLIGPSSTLSSINSDTLRGSTRGNFFPEPTTTSASPARSIAPSGNLVSAANNTTGKKEDMVIYYYYYYDDNKNATVVAKNVTTGAPLNPVALDAAIEADGGVEDTPYMDDVAPENDVRTSSAKPQSPTTPSSTTTTSTTMATPSVSPFNSFERSNSDRKPSRNQFAAATQSNPPEIERNFNQDSRSDHPRLPSSTRIPPIERFRSGLDTNQASNLDFSSANRFASTEPTTAKVLSAHPNRATSGNGNLPTAPNSRIENQIIQNALSGSAGQQSRLQPTPSTPTSTTTAGSRTPLSNASRYGTSNGQSLDPYGLDPTSPANFGHSDTSSHHTQKSWSQGSPHPNHQSHRKPSPSVAPAQLTPLDDDVPRNVNPARAQKVGQPFTSQRNQNSVQAQNQRTNSGALKPASQQAQPVPRPSSGQIFPESQSLPVVDQGPRVSTSTTRQSVVERPQSQPERSRDDIEPPRSTGDDNATAAELDGQQDVPREQRNNGRPSTPESEVTNSFVRTSTSPSVSPQNPSSPRLILPERQGSSQSINLQPSVSTSVSRTFMTPQQIQVTTSMSTQSVSTSSVVSTNSSPSASSTTLQTTTPAPLASSPTPSSSESSPSTESPAVSSSTRRIFGNRNNRFQTRLTAVARSTSTTTSTTPSPSSSTTRRPTTSTTRKSSRQLFSGRNRLNSISSTVPPTSDNANNNTSANSEPEASSTSSPVRSRFGNNFTPRSRSTTASPEQSVSRSASIGPQRATFKPRLPFLRANKPNPMSIPVATETTGQPEAASTAPINGPIQDPNAKLATTEADKPSSSKPELVNDGANLSIADETTTGGMTDETNVTGEKETSATPPSASVGSTSNLTESPATTTTAAPAETGRNKPRRPLFASRQRNSSLFGNRRSSNGTSAV